MSKPSIGRSAVVVLGLWLALLAQVLAPSLCVATPGHGTATMAICSADGIRYVPVPGDGPAFPAHDPHDLCGMCCSHCPRACLPARVAVLVPPPAIPPDHAWQRAPDIVLASAGPSFQRPPGRAPPQRLV